MKSDDKIAGNPAGSPHKALPGDIIAVRSPHAEKIPVPSLRAPRTAPVVVPYSCAACVFWKPKDVTGAFPTMGECHRHAPAPVLTAGSDARVVWPPVHRDETCGGQRASRPRGSA